MRALGFSPDGALLAVAREDGTAELVDVRRQMFEEVHLPHQYDALREVVDAVPAHVLSQPHGVIAAQYARDWRSCLDVSSFDRGA